ncbi:30S ribosomal protein S19 [bacterium (Candidatus Moisslbacteria) CG12_big_fil_rev_8_21_14_0_65_36_11]|nr:30S ribosomal protein S19 [Candidatus Kuenenbacteria bacterium]OIP76370.1 MAG: 30S ribosomal protein S19 [Parcubacteria group bacterium CG2_30_36_38]PIV45991.1 MAG: 30S ribosomal protein S19 [bacterium (Candidatus Moisslbacteria) CG02_land_8_20_14_3_00_36_53]PIW68129.1 MAG: 30S ribosomal protein S19 [bacterium (Candidatus Moisslbacteria) CG12_big_fil_rev_8_21_14_0_65_36_11]PIZ90464.1 MAG: 30S ribosomal protein S19 [bacterium (Candidatus Moisslbacteria) CG_4_10_14_0_2_um_filter_36_61]PJC0089
MARSLKKGPWVDPKLQKKIEQVKAGKDIRIKTWSRSSQITPEMVGLSIEVHDGRKHVPVLIIEDMVGCRLGEFAPTRKFVKHGGRMQRELEQGEKQKTSAAAGVISTAPSSAPAPSPTPKK